MSAPVRILVVDDDAAIADTLREYLAADGYDIAVVFNDADAVDVGARRKPDLVLLDIAMPVMDGVEALRRIKALDAAIPVIMVTGNHEEERGREALAIGAFDYVMKPFRFDRLSEVITAALLFRSDAEGGVAP